MKRKNYSHLGIAYEVGQKNRLPFFGHSILLVTVRVSFHVGHLPTRFQGNVDSTKWVSGLHGN